MKTLTRYYKSFIDKRNRLFAKSEVVSVLKNTTKTYSANKEEIGKIRAMTFADTANVKEFGFVNSLFAGAGAIFGTACIPSLGGAVAGAECFLKILKSGTNLAQKTRNKFIQTA